MLGFGVGAKQDSTAALRCVVKVALLYAQGFKDESIHGLGLRRPQYIAAYRASK